MFSLGQRVQPATMIGFKQIEFFDHTGPGPPRYEGKWSSKEDRRPHSHPDPGAAHRHVRVWPQSSGSHHSVNSQDNEASAALLLPLQGTYPSFGQGHLWRIDPVQRLNVLKLLPPV